MNNVKNKISHEYCQNQLLEFESFKRKDDCILEKHAPFLEKHAISGPTKHLIKIKTLANIL